MSKSSKRYTDILSCLLFHFIPFIEQQSIIWKKNRGLQSFDSDKSSSSKGSEDSFEKDFKKNQSKKVKKQDKDEAAASKTEPEKKLRERWIRFLC